MQEIAVELTRRGIKTPQGKSPDRVFVTNQFSSIYAVGRITKPPKKFALRGPRIASENLPSPSPAPSPVTKDPANELQLTILTDPQLSDKKKLALLSVLLS